jgi:hypothetical protein
MNSKEDYLTKLKPVLGQNQINISSFINDFNKKSSLLNPELVVRSIILKNIDKSYDISINYPPLELVLNTLKVSNNQNILTLSKYQDLVVSIENFDKKLNPNIFNQFSKIERYKIYSKIILSSLSNLKYKII